MTEKLTLVDSDILINILKKKGTAYTNSKTYLAQYGRFKISCLTYYECLRNGDKILGATKRIQAFQELLVFTDIILH